MDNLPFATPILLRSTYGLDLQNLHGTDVAKCVKLLRGEDRKTKVRGSMILHRVSTNAVAIQSFRNKRFLAVNDAGDCRFTETDLLDDKFQFYVEMRVITSFPNHLFFISRTTGKALQCTSSGAVRCENENLGNREAWAVVELGKGGLQSDCAFRAEPIVATYGNENEELRAWIIELVKLNMRPDKIRELVQIAFPAAIPQQTSSLKQVDEETVESACRIGRAVSF